MCRSGSANTPSAQARASSTPNGCGTPVGRSFAQRSQSMPIHDVRSEAGIMCPVASPFSNGTPACTATSPLPVASTNTFAFAAHTPLGAATTACVTASPSRTTSMTRVWKRKSAPDSAITSS